MAGFHPFRSFQKNQKFWLAILGVGTMISFIILPVLMQLFTGGGGPTIEEFGRSRRFGVVNEQTIYALSQNRQNLEGFYQVLYQRLADPGDESKMAALNYLGSLANTYSQRADSRQLVDNWLLAQYARSQGLNIDQNDVVAFLSQLTSGYLSDALFREVLQSVGLTEKRLEYLISLELLSAQMRQSFDISMSAITPATRWDWFQRMNRQVTAEVAAVPVDRFIEKVGEPTDVQLRQFFEKHKEKRFNPMSSDSGFIVPSKVAFQYVRAVPSQAMFDSISDAEIEKYYEAHKDAQFLKPVKPIGERPGLPGQDPGSMFRPGLGGFTPTPGLNRSTAFPTPTTRIPNLMTPGEIQDNQQDAPKTPETETPVEQPKPETPQTEEKPAEAEKTSSMMRSVRTRFVSYQTETEPKPATESKPEEKKEETKPEEKKEEPKPEAQSEKQQEEAASETKTEEPEKAEAVDLSILYRPLEEVKGEIRETLAREKAMEALSKAEEKMREYFQTYNLHVDMETDPPVMPDLSGFVREIGLELVTVELDTFYEAVKSDFARGTLERERLLQLFMESPLLFQPENFAGSNGSYLYWVTETVSEFKPEKMEDVRDLVVRRWKEVEARPLAMKQAEELALEAKSSGKPLEEAFAEKNEIHVVDTEPFFWRTYGPGVSPWMAIWNRIPPPIGEVCEKGVAVGDAEIDNKWIFAPGNEFMTGVYALQVGETGAVFNEPRTVAYVVRITSSNPSDDVLWERFQLAHPMEYSLAGQQEVVEEAREAWMKSIYEEIGFEWTKNPQSFYGR